ncbi:MAG: hypothetical protein B7Y16_07870 [Methylotenera sp. 24-45-7]|jgi:hypothetical protein|nr:MAG: hypothetical protein B7Y72_02815 [Mehylophilales bacterium 35-46-6]OYZ39871.1 MAG: hypothetical protein B7Y16_07870 [Methylotenera sp. 24-45-7]OZA09818.1 MAG: hypothetical protein B7X97_01210 [Methylotenera sp. 17-45-7]OZA53337.1 MAG: hypothetical protein B7X73_04770 [Methylophilales bacterium 39-45-7]HQS37795.1 hypothetical protein [Methylotenera sp.]
MKRNQVIGKTVLPSDTKCMVTYNSVIDMVELQVGGTSLRFNANSFILVQELLRKAAAKVVMQTAIVNV